MSAKPARPKEEESSATVNKSLLSIDYESELVNMLEVPVTRLNSSLRHREYRNVGLPQGGRHWLQEAKSKPFLPSICRDT